MRIKPVVRKRVLTKFKDDFNQNRQKLPQYPVMLYVNDRGKVYYLSTGFTTTSVDLSDGIFHDEDLSTTQNLIKSQRLNDLVEKACKYAQEYRHQSVEKIKLGLTKLVSESCDVSNRTPKDKKDTIADLSLKIAETYDNENTRTSYVYLSRKIDEFKEIKTVADINKDMLNKFEAFLFNDGISQNSIHLIMAKMKHLCAWLEDNGYAVDMKAFDGLNIQYEETWKLTLTAQDIADFRDYPVRPKDQKYKDFCLLSFYMAGINGIDLLKWDTIHTGRRIVFSRSKTDVIGDFRISDEAWEIIQKYRDLDKVLNFFEDKKSYDQFKTSTNRFLKRMGLVIMKPAKNGRMRKKESHPIWKDLEVYTFRRSFATIASEELDISVEVIGQCLTHKRRANNITERYIKRSPKKADDCIKKVCDLVSSLKGRSKEEIDAEIRLRDNIKDE